MSVIKSRRNFVHYQINAKNHDKNNDNVKKNANSFVQPSEVTRLMSAVSFGYGIFQLCVSLLPPSLLKVIHFLGFEGDRQAGLTALMFSRSSQDMRAPLATYEPTTYVFMYI